MQIGKLGECLVVQTLPSPSQHECSHVAWVGVSQDEVIVFRICPITPHTSNSSIRKRGLDVRNEFISKKILEFLDNLDQRCADKLPKARNQLF